MLRDPQGKRVLQALEQNARAELVSHEPLPSLNQGRTLELLVRSPHGEAIGKPPPRQTAPVL